MRIYGKSLTEIFAEMPWQFKVIIMAGMIWIPFALIHATYIFVTLGRSISKPGIVDFTNNPVNASVSDPSIVDSPDGRSAYMAFTIFTKYPNSLNKDGRWSPGIRLAQAHAGCKVWGDLGQVVNSTQEEVPGPDGINQLDPAGVWSMEQPSLIYDPADTGKEYKLFYYRYLWLGPEESHKQLSRLYGMIGYKYTSDPTLGSKAWSTEQWIFSARPKTGEKAMDGNPPEPYNGLIQYHLSDFDPSLKDVYFYARPSAVVMGDVIYLSLSAFLQAGDTPDRTVLLASNDHARTWHYVGALMGVRDVARMGPYKKFGGGTLILKNGKLYFSAVLGDDKVMGLGSFIVPFEDPSKALLAHNAKTGAPDFVNHLDRISVKPSAIGGGYAAYSPLCKQVYESEYSDLKQNMHIFQTQKDLLER